VTTNVPLLCIHTPARSVPAEARLKHHTARLNVDVHDYGAGISAQGVRSKGWDEFLDPDTSIARAKSGYGQRCSGSRDLRTSP
jgi:hypothetical protein